MHGYINDVLCIEGSLGNIQNLIAKCIRKPADIELHVGNSILRFEIIETFFCLGNILTSDYDCDYVASRTAKHAINLEN